MIHPVKPFHELKVKRKRTSGDVPCCRHARRHEKNEILSWFVAGASCGYWARSTLGRLTGAEVLLNQVRKERNFRDSAHRSPSGSSFSRGSNGPHEVVRAAQTSEPQQAAIQDRNQRREASWQTFEVMILSAHLGLQDKRLRIDGFNYVNIDGARLRYWRRALCVVPQEFVSMANPSAGIRHRFSMIHFGSSCKRRIGLQFKCRCCY